MRCVRPDLTTVANSSALASRAFARWSSAGTRSRTTPAVAATCTEVGKTSFEDCEALTWSFGWTSAPRRREASVARTSLVFMFELVPEPVWNTSTGKCSSCAPVATSSAAPTIASAISAGRTPSSAFARAAAFLTRASASMWPRSSGVPEIGKFSTARCVCARYSAFAGTRTSPIVSCSIRKSAMGRFSHRSAAPTPDPQNVTWVTSHLVRVDCPELRISRRRRPRGASVVDVADRVDHADLGFDEVVLRAHDRAPSLGDGPAQGGRVVVQHVHRVAHVLAAQDGRLGDRRACSGPVEPHDARDDPVDDRPHEAGRDLARAQRVRRGLDRPAVVVTEHDDERGPEHVEPVLDRADHGRVEHVARGAHDDHVAEALVEDDLGSDARVGAAEDHREGVLAVPEGRAPRGVLVGVLGGALDEALVARAQALPGLGGGQAGGHGAPWCAPGQSSSALVGGSAPGRLTVIAAMRAQRVSTAVRVSASTARNASRRWAPSSPALHSPSTSPPMNESPAPTVSATSTRGAATSTRTPPEVTAIAPSPPRVTTTTAGPRVAQRAAASVTGSPGAYHARSSSLTLTTSAASSIGSTCSAASAGVPMRAGRMFGS